MSERKIDILTLELLREALPAVADEMAEVLMRTAYNMFIYEVKDFSTSILDGDGELIARPRTAGSIIAAAVGDIIAYGIKELGKENLNPGDILGFNIPYVTGQHTNNVSIYKPVFYKGEIIAFTVASAHWLDVGGAEASPGVGTSTDVFQEGILFRNVKVYKAGELNETFVQFIQENCRRPDLTLGDFRACVGSCNIAETRFLALVEKYGLDTIREAARIIKDTAEQRVRAGIEKIPDGTYEAESFLDGVVGGDIMPVKVKVTVKGSDFHVDYTGTGPEVPGPINSTTVGTIAARGVVKMLADPKYYVNSGTFRPISTTVPPGTFISCSRVAPQGVWSLTLSTIADTILKALAPVLPDRIPAGHKADQGECSFYGLDKNDKYWISATIRNGGHGGRYNEDGQNAAINIMQGNLGMAAVELLEQQFPLYIERYEFIQDGCGAGKFRGGLGPEIKIRPFGVDYVTSMITCERFKCPPWGLFGGKPGVGNHHWVDLADGKGPQLMLKAPRTKVPKGGYIAFRGGGGGGWGDPLDRDPEMVLADVINGYVSNEAAKSEYGVVLDREKEKVDEEATKSLRAQMRKQRAEGPNPLDRDPQMVLADFISGNISVAKAISEYGVVLNWQKQEIDKNATKSLRAQMRKERAMVAPVSAKTCASAK